MAGNIKRAYTVVFAKQMAEVPAQTLYELRLSLKEIGQACETVPPASPFWQSMAESDSILDVDTWRFNYAIDRVAKRITVKGYKRLP